MPITISDLRREERQVTVVYYEDEFSITYKPGHVTPELEDVLQKAQERDRPAHGLAEVLALLLVEWEVLDADGKMLPIEVEIMDSMPTEFLSTMLLAITEDSRAGREDRKNSGGGSARRAGSAKSRSGTH